MVHISRVQPVHACEKKQGEKPAHKECKERGVMSPFYEEREPSIVWGEQACDSGSKLGEDGLKTGL